MDPLEFDDTGILDVGYGSLVTGVGSLRIHYHDPGKAPEVIKNYIIGDVIGAGSYGKVYEGFNSTTMRMVAIKKMDKGQIRKRNRGMDSVEQEIEVLQALQCCKRTVQSLDFISDEDNDTMYIILELITGCTLQELLDSAPDKRLPRHQAQDIFIKLIEAVAEIHKRSVVHRDLKPENIMLTSSGDLKLSDFGSAELLNQQELDDVSRTIGSPAFQAPELARGKEKFSGYKADIWAAGVTLFIMVLGKPPFDGTTLYELWENIGRGEFSLPEDIEKSNLGNLLRGILHVDERKRLSIKQILDHPWITKKETDVDIPAVPIPVRHHDIEKYLVDLYPEADQAVESPTTGRRAAKQDMKELLAKCILM
eukprot:Rmarinus@m.6288